MGPSPVGLAQQQLGLARQCRGVPGLIRLLQPLPQFLQPCPGRFVFVPGSRADDVMGYWQVEAEGPPGCLRIVAFHPTEDDTGLDVAQPIVIEGELAVIRHPARG